MQIFEHEGYKVRFMYQPNKPIIQVNIYNPDDVGHSLASFISLETTTDENGNQVVPQYDLEKVFNTVVDNGGLDQMLERAKLAFVTPSPTEQG